MILRTAVLLSLLAACSTPEVGGRGGRGLVSVDRAVPASRLQVSRPEWLVGDRFVYRRGGKIRLEYRVTGKTEQGYILQEVGTRMEFALGLDLERLSESIPGQASEQRVFAPSDHVLTWPLWVGKRWSCEYHLRNAGAASVPVLVNYECDARETITVPAGSFDCFRIWRRSRPLIEGNYFDKVSLLWYAPGVGYFVRRLEGEVVTELESYQRQ